jgi:hypothetical protein
MTLWSYSMAIIPVIIYQIQEMPLYNVNVVNIKKTTQYSSFVFGCSRHWDKMVWDLGTGSERLDQPDLFPAASNSISKAVTPARNAWQRLGFATGRKQCFNDDFSKHVGALKILTPLVFLHRKIANLGWFWGPPFKAIHPKIGTWDTKYKK